MVENSSNSAFQGISRNQALYLPSIGEFQVEKPILCSKVYPSKDTKNDEANQESQRKSTHTVYQIQEDPQGTLENFLNPLVALCVEIRVQEKGQEVGLEQVEAAYKSALISNFQEDLRIYNRLYKVIVIKFIENSTNSEDFEGQSPYLSEQSVQFFKSKDVICLGANTTSIDQEIGSKNKNAFLDGNSECIIIESIDTSRLQAGAYILDISILPQAGSYSPCVLKAKRIVSCIIDEAIKPVLSDENILQTLNQRSLHWSQLKHPSSVQTDVSYPINDFVMDVVKLDHTQQFQKNGKDILNLSYGDPKKANGFSHPQVDEAILEVLKDDNKKGYTLYNGSNEARQAIVEKFSRPETPFTAKDVFMTHGGHGTLFGTLQVLCNYGDNIMVSRPSYTLVGTICQNLGVELKYYDLLPDQGFEVDIESLKKQINSRTKAIVVVNPSNPCSSVFSKEHQLEIIKVAEEFKIPLLCDEVYYGIVYPGKEYHSFANLTKEVPMICVSSISKMYCLPGWRVGWIIVYNRHGYLDNVQKHLEKYMKIPTHPSTLVMHALPRIMRETTQAHFDEFNGQLAKISSYFYEKLQGIRGIQAIKAEAAMYMFVRIVKEELKDIKDDSDFCVKLFEEEACLTLPSYCFFESDFFRIFTAVSTDMADEFVLRLKRFLEARYN